MIGQTRIHLRPDCAVVGGKKDAAAISADNEIRARDGKASNIAAIWSVSLHPLRNCNIAKNYEGDK